MAERRMFAKTIIDSDAFLDMPLSAQALYFHLNMRADDDGFINNPKKIQRMVGASDDDLKLLKLKSFVLEFETGVIVIKHWKINNYIQKDRYKKTMYQEEKSLLTIKENGSYTLEKIPCIHDVYNMDTQVRLGKVSIGKDRLGKVSLNNELTEEQIDNMTDEEYAEYLERGIQNEKGKVKRVLKNRINTQKHSIHHTILMRLPRFYIRIFAHVAKKQ